MTRVVVVNHDPATAGQEAAMLRAAGYEVRQCGGPLEEHCPVLSELPCALADWADVLVYDAWAAGDSDGGRQLVAHVREVYADLPMVLTAVDDRLDWVETEGPLRVTPLVGQPALEDLRKAIETALQDQGMAV
ncbi:MAG: hypothetical protein ACP5VP_02595 [Candidatus Limnocylindrales bacterium]